MGVQSEVVIREGLVGINMWLGIILLVIMVAWVQSRSAQSLGLAMPRRFISDRRSSPLDAHANPNVWRLGSSS
jgi:hypothetical protein